MERLPRILSLVITWTVFTFLPLTYLAYNRRFLRTVSPTRGKFGKMVTGFVIFLACIIAMCFVEELLEDLIDKHLNDLTQIALIGVTCLILFIMFIIFRKKLAK